MTLICCKSIASRASRRGFTLVELLVVFVISSALLTALGATLQLAYRTTGAQQTDYRDLNAALRLAERFRRDCRDAVSRSLEGTAALTLTFDDGGTATYRCENAAVQLEVEDSEGRRSREIYRLPRKASAAIFVENAPLENWRLEIYERTERRRHVICAFVPRAKQGQAAAESEEQP